MQVRHVLVAVGLLFGAALAGAAQERQPRFDIRVEARQLSFEELSRLVPALAQVKLPPGFRITKLEARGPLEELAIDFAAQSPDSSIQASAVVDASEPGRTARGSASLRNVDLAALLVRPALPSDVTADLVYDLAFGGDEAGVRGTFGVEAPSLDLAGFRGNAIRVKGRVDGSDLQIDGSLRAYGASVTADGQITLGEALQYEIRGRARNVDLRRLPERLHVPELASDLHLAYRVAGTGNGLRGRITLDRSTLAGATVAQGTAATFEQREGELRYHAEGRLAGLDLRELGRALEVDALSAPRFDSDITARFSVDGRGARLDPVQLTLEDSVLFGGRVPDMRVRVGFSEEALTFAADGAFEALAVGVLAQRENVQGVLTGRLDVEGRVPRADEGLQTDRLTANGRVAIAPSTIEGVAIAEGVIAGGLQNGELVRIDRLQIAGDGLAIRASGDVGLDPSVETSLEYYVDSPPLGALTDLIGVDLAGELTLEGRVTGAEVLQVAGTLAATGVSYQQNGAAELSSRYTLSVPHRDLPSAHGEVEATASQLELGGQTFEELEASTTYRDGRATFDATLSRADEALTIGGRLDWREEQKAVELTSLGLRAAGADWQLASGSTPRITYGGEGVAVSELKLVSSPDQAISIDGRFGREGDAARIRLEGVALEPFARMAGREDLRGTLTAEATIAETMEAPAVNATFSLSGAAVRDVELSAVSGRVTLGSEQLAFDARVERPDASWLRAEGHLPSALLRGDEAARAAGTLDITVESSPVGLELVQLFTDQLQEVRGTLEADVRVTGTLDDPRPSGEIRIAGGAFTVPRLGTQYVQLDGKVSLQPDVITVSQLRLVDDDGDHLTVNGRLPVQRLRVTGVELEVTSDGLEVMDNALGDVEAGADLTVTGELTEPRVSGTIEITEGTLNVDEILSLAGQDTYAVRAAEQGLLTEPAGQPAGLPQDRGLLADLPLSLDITVAVPNLLLRGRDIRGPAGGGVGLGNVNLNAKGALALRKAPEDALRISGDVAMVRGTYEFQGREFELARGGTVRFTGLPEINPLLDVTARREISAVETIVAVSGTLREPTLELSSNPPLDDADILSLIVFNRPVNSLGAGEQVSLANRASALATGFVAGQLTEAIGGAFDIDLFQVEARNADGLGPAVTLGERIGDLFVKVQQQFGSESQSRMIVEYEVNQWLRLESSFVDDRNSAQPLLRRQEDSGFDAVVNFDY